MTWLANQWNTTIQFNHVGCQILNNHSVHQVVLGVNGDQVNRQFTCTFVDADKLGLDTMGQFDELARLLHRFFRALEVTFASQLQRS